MPSYSLARWSCVITSPVAYCAPAREAAGHARAAHTRLGILWAALRRLGGTPRAWAGRTVRRTACRAGSVPWHTKADRPVGIYVGLGLRRHVLKALAVLGAEHAPALRGIAFSVIGRTAFRADDDVVSLFQYFMAGCAFAAFVTIMQGFLQIFLYIPILLQTGRESKGQSAFTSGFVSNYNRKI